MQVGRTRRERGYQESAVARRSCRLLRRVPAYPAQLAPLIQPKAVYSDTPFRIIVQHGQIISMLGLYTP